MNRSPHDPSPGARLLSVRDESVRVTEACTACGACLATCPERALRRAPKRPLVVDAACTACWACIEICPAGAIEPVRSPPPQRTDRTSTPPAAHSSWQFPGWGR